MSEDRTDDQTSNVTALKEGIASGAESARDLAGGAQTAAAQTGSTIRAAASEASKQAGDAGSKVYQQSAQAAEQVSRSVAEQPLTALLIAGAIGYALAYMIHGR